MACTSFNDYVNSHTLIPQKVQWYPEHLNTVVIVQPSSSLVIDAKQSAVQLAEYTGSPLQQWLFECAEDGTFLLKNVGTEYYLAISEDEKQIITKAKDGGANQQWSYSLADKIIHNPASKKVLDLQFANLHPGSKWNN